MSQAKLELVSFKTCPYVQRAVIVLREKQVPFDITYIDLASPPEWFRAISPLGKVPLLKVDGTVLFESAVIAEYLDEVYPPRLHPADALRRAHNRAWIEFASSLFGEQFQMLMAPDRAAFDAAAARLAGSLDRLEGEVGAGPYFNGATLALVDCAFAPFLLRASLMEPYLKLGVFAARPRLERWRAALLARESVRQSVVPEFAELLIAGWRGRAPLGRELFAARP
jgi:glutathione S-transferase